MAKTESDHIVLSVDPGQDKCGVAVVKLGGQVLFAKVVARSELESVARELLARHNIRTLVVGGGTGTRKAQALLRRAAPDLPLVVVDERGTTLLARKRYFTENPPKGWRRLIPLSLQVPPDPYDHYVAILLAERYLETYKEWLSRQAK